MDFTPSPVLSILRTLLLLGKTSPDVEDKLTSFLENSYRFLDEKFPKEGASFEIRIRDATNEAGDILKHFMNDQILSIISAINEFIRQIVVISLSTDNPSDYYHELKEVMLEINSICRNVKSLNTTKNEQRKLIKKIFGSTADNPRYDFGEAEEVISQTTAEVKSLSPTENVVVGDSPPTVRYAAGGVTVGLDDDVLKIKDLLTGGSSKLHTIPIAGMGGIGKSTLAMNAYNDPLIMETFMVRAWVTVSQDYETENVFSVLVDLFKEVGDVRSGKSMMEKVYKFLYGKKYLIVLDDIWSTQAWDAVKKAFPNGGDGSRIIITTRIQDVASHASSLNYIHQMSFMDEYRSWDLLKQKVFANKCCPSGLVDVGMDIARSCRGLPLAIVLVAGILGILSTVNETRFWWLEVAKKVRLCVDEEGGRFEKVISLSYTHLPRHLRVCFLYMGGFPEDYEIRVSKLIKLWIAEGFVEPRSGKSLEECGEELLDDLVKRSLALVTKRKSNGKIKSCNVHDLVRDICRRKALEENLERCRSVAHPNLMFLSKIFPSTMRSVTCFRPSRSELGAVTGFTLLRVLDLVEAFFDSFPAPVLDLFHLRYLGFSFRGVIEIPAAISRLQSLLTLLIYSRNSKYELHLPFEIWMMPLLTHLVSSVPLSLNLDGVASTLEELVTLSEVRRFTCSKKMTQMIPNIKKLGITYCDNDAGDYELHNLVLLHQLEKLKLNGYNVSLKVNPVFPQTLKKLTLSGWRFPWKYMETVGSLPNLQVLKLRCYACDGHTWETKEEQFLSLEFLYIYNSSLENLVTESSHFPKLKRIVFFRCSRLSQIPDDIGEIPTLQLIEVDSENTSLLKCARKIQEDQRDNGNYGLQVGCLYDHQVLVKSWLFDSLFKDILRLKCMISTVKLYEKTDGVKVLEELKYILRKGKEKEWAWRKGQAAGLKNWHFRGVGLDGPPRRWAQSGGQQNPHFGGSARGCPPRKRT